MKRLAAIAIACSCLLSAACAEQPQKAEFARRSFPQFQDEVYPVLLRDCAFPACHGDSKRFFRIWGPGRVRLPGAMSTPEAFDLPTIAELSATQSFALSMIDTRAPASSPLLRKPLAVEAGGAGHFGVDRYGRDIYRTKQDSGYLVLRSWVLAAQPAAPAKTP